MTGSKRWLQDAPDAGSQALRQALDEARPGPDDEAFARQRVWPRVQAPWWNRSGKAVAPVDVRGGGWLAPLLVGAGVAIVATMAVLVSAGWLRTVAPTLVAGPVAPAAPDIQAIPLAPATVTVTAPLTTGPDERIRQRLARGVEAELLPRTALLPGDAQTPPEVRVGRVRFSVPHQAPGQRYRVRAGAFQVVVLGTTFDVSVDETGVSVDVDSGTVEVQDAASERPLQRLTAGSTWSSGERPPSAAPVHRERARRMARPVGKPPARRLAQALERAAPGRPADPRRAIAHYEKVVAAGGPMAEVALYGIGEIQYRELGDLRRAAATWERYRQRYPQGLARVEADLSLLEVLAHLGESARALQEARAFLDRHQDSERRAEVARLAGDLARKAGDCPTALGFYDRTLDSRPSPADADDALFYRAECLTSQRDARSGDAVRAYLGRFPLGRHAVEAQGLLRGARGPASLDPEVR